MPLNIALITDRTHDDVVRWQELRSKGFAAMTAEEQEEWLLGPRGAYTPHIDMNRVANAIRFIVQLFALANIRVDVVAKNDWTYADIPTPTDLENYLQDVRTLRDAVSLNGYALPSSMRNLTYIGANDIEKMLQYVTAEVERLRETWWYCSEIYCGEV